MFMIKRRMIEREKNIKKKEGKGLWLCVCDW